MSESTEDERERIREQKKRELQEKLESGGGTSTPEKEGTPGDPIEIEGREHLQEVVDSYPVVLVDCYADWCGPCKMLEPTIESLAAETDAAIAKVDVDRHQPIAQQLGARGVPTLVLYANGEPVHRQSGVQDKATLKSLIQRHS